MTDKTDRTALCLHACRNLDNEQLADDGVEKLREDRNGLLVENLWMQNAITELVNAGKGMLERFDRSALAMRKPMRQCRRMQAAINKVKGGNE